VLPRTSSTWTGHPPVETKRVTDVPALTCSPETGFVLDTKPDGIEFEHAGVGVVTTESPSAFKRLEALMIESPATRGIVKVPPGANSYNVTVDFGGTGVLGLGV
jgi:hypothetical protein